MNGERQLKDMPLLIELPSEYIQPSPWLAIADKRLKPMHGYRAKVGLSPVSHSQVEARPPHRQKH